MKALILAAGLGNRLGAAMPKALVRVAGQELLGHQLAFLKNPRIEKIGVVTGFQAPKLADFIQTLDSKIEIFENRRFTEGNILSLQAALPFLDDDFLLLNVDHIYPQRLLETVFKQAKGITACSDFDRELVADDMKISVDQKNHLKEIDKGLKKYDGGYIGMTFCPKSRLKHYIAGLEKTLAAFGTKTNVEKILGELANAGETIHIANTSGIRWLEVDTPEDLKLAEKALHEKKGL